MISGEKIAEYIKNPHHVNSIELVDLQKLIAKYPYCSTLHLLNLKALAVSNHLDFENQLKTTAIHAHDRSHLYQFIHSGTVSETSKIATEKEQIEGEPTDLAITAETTEKPTETVAPTTPEPITEAPEINAVESHSEVESIEEEEVVADAEALALTEDAEEEKAAIEENAESALEISDELDVEIYNTAIDIAYATSGITPDDETTEVSEAIEEELPEITANLTEAEEEPIKTEAETPEQVTAQKEEAPINKANLSFIEWLKYKQNHTTDSNETPQEKTTLPTDAEEEEAPIIEENPKPTRSEIDALLDKFIAEEPSISRPVKDFYNPAKSAKESVEESEDLVSETLAKIYVMQKNYSKAIDAYDKLILLYPEKKAFFASQIEKIREELKKR